MIELKINKTLQSAQKDFILDLDLIIEQGKLVCIYGDSGAGKTTLLRIISGLISPTEGSIIVNHKTWFDSEKKIDLKTQKRNIGFVFQENTLFPNMTVGQNIAYALQSTKNKDWYYEILTMMDLNELENRFPDTLSGGQKQRVALARSIAAKPSILLLDEPLSALDHGKRSELQDHILKIHQRMDLTTIMISHDMAEILKMADLAIRMEKGKLLKIDMPLQLFTNKQMSGKFQFIGEIIDIQPSDIVYIVSVLIGKNLVKVVADQVSANDLKIGDQVVVASKAFNPMISKIEE